MVFSPPSFIVCHARTMSPVHPRVPLICLSDSRGKESILFTIASRHCFLTRMAQQVQCSQARRTAVHRTAPRTRILVDLSLVRQSDSPPCDHWAGARQAGERLRGSVSHRAGQLGPGAGKRAPVLACALRVAGPDEPRRGAAAYARPGRALLWPRNCVPGALVPVTRLHAIEPAQLSHARGCQRAMASRATGCVTVPNTPTVAHLSAPLHTTSLGSRAALARCG